MFFFLNDDVFSSTMATTGWKSSSALTLRVRTWSWWKTAQTYMSVSTPVTSPLQMSWRATGCCTNTPITGDASTSCVRGSTGGTASGGAPALPSVLWDGSLSLTDSRLYFLSLPPRIFFFFLNPHCSSQLSFPPFCSTSLFEHCVNTLVSKPEITPWQGFVGFWFYWVALHCFGKASPAQCSSNAHGKKERKGSFGCPPAKRFCRDGPQPPVPLEWQ